MIHFAIKMLLACGFYLYSPPHALCIEVHNSVRICIVDSAWWRFGVSRYDFNAGPLQSNWWPL